MPRQTVAPTLTTLRAASPCWNCWWSASWRCRCRRKPVSARQRAAPGTRGRAPGRTAGIGPRTGTSQRRARALAAMPQGFRFEGLPASAQLLAMAAARGAAQPATPLILGPEPLIPPQSVTLTLRDPTAARCAWPRMDCGPFRAIPAMTGIHGPRRRHGAPRRLPHGFTLIEVLVALGIVGIALMASLRPHGPDSQCRAPVRGAAGPAVRAKRAGAHAPVAPDAARGRQRPDLRAGRPATAGPAQRAPAQPQLAADALVVTAEHPVLRVSTIVGRQIVCALSPARTASPWWS